MPQIRTISWLGIICSFLPWASLYNNVCLSIINRLEIKTGIPFRIILLGGIFMKNDLMVFIEDSKYEDPKALNVDFVEFAKKNNLTLIMGSNYSCGYVPKDEREQAIAIDKEFIKVLAVFGAKLQPSYKDILSKLSSSPANIKVNIIHPEYIYEGEIYNGILGKVLDIWMDTNKLRYVDPISNELFNFMVSNNSKVTLEMVDMLLWWTRNYEYGISIVNEKILLVDLQMVDEENNHIFDTNEFIEDWIETISSKADAHGSNTSESHKWLEEIEIFKVALS